MKNFLFLFLFPFLLNLVISQAYANCDLLGTKSEQKQCHHLVNLIHLAFESTRPEKFGACWEDKISFADQNLCLGMQRGLMQLPCEKVLSIPLSKESFLICQGMQLGQEKDFKKCFSLWPDRSDPENLQKITCLGVVAGISGRKSNLKGLSLSRQEFLLRAMEEGFEIHREKFHSPEKEKGQDFATLCLPPSSFLPKITMPIPPIIEASRAQPAPSIHLPPLVSTPDKGAEKYVLKSLEEEYQGEERKGVIYFDHEKRQRFKIQVKGGRIYNSQGQLFTSMAVGGTPLSIFVMDKNGEIYITNEMEVDKIHHSSLLAGEDVAAAGEIVIENGRVRYLSNGSGHYKPGQVHMEQLIKHLRAQGVSLAGVEFELIQKGRKKKIILRQ